MAKSNFYWRPLLNLELFIDGNLIDYFPMSATDQLNGRVAIVVKLNDIDSGIMLFQAKDVCNGNTQNMPQDDPIDPAVADDCDIALAVAADDFLKPGQDTVSELGKRFSSFDLERRDVLHALLQHSGETAVDLIDAQAFPIAET